MEFVVKLQSATAKLKLNGSTCTPELRHLLPMDLKYPTNQAVNLWSFRTVEVALTWTAKWQRQLSISCVRLESKGLEFPGELTNKTKFESFDSNFIENLRNLNLPAGMGFCHVFPQPIFPQELLSANPTSLILQHFLPVAFVVVSSIVDHIVAASDKLDSADFALDDGVFVDLHVGGAGGGCAVGEREFVDVSTRSQATYV
jgi:hypothetical protein